MTSSSANDLFLTTTAEEEAYRHVLRAIRTGRFKPGARLIPEEIANEIGMSRMPVREAFRRLSTEGLVLIRPNRGCLVAGLTIEEIYEVFEMRSVLEGLAVRLAMPKLNAEAFSELDRLLARMERGGQGNDDWVTRHREFHEYLCAFSGRPKLIRQIASLHVTIEPYLRIWFHHVEKPLSAEEEHRAIIRALQTGDPILAEAAMEQHVLDTAPALAAFIAESGVNDGATMEGFMKMIAKSASLVALTICALAFSPVRAQEKPTAITIATEGAYAPWNFTGPDGKAAGFEIDLANDLCARMKVKCTIVIQDWDGLIPALNVGKFDVIMASMFITDKRLEVINFSRPYAIDPSGFAVSKTSALAKSDLSGKFDLDNEAAALPVIEKMKPLMKGLIVGVQAATTNLQFLKKYFDGTVEIREYKTTEQHDLDLAAGRVDALFAQDTALAATLGKPEFSAYTLAGPGFLKGVFGRGTAAGIRKKDVALVGMFNEAIGAAIADGTIKQLSLKWLKADVTPPQ